MKNLYRQILQESLPRLYALFDTDPMSPTYGVGDREYWGWKVKDFPNGTFQGGVHALAIAHRLGLTPHPEDTIKLINSAILAIPKTRASNGSLSEAYFQENSYCVTALVAFDALAALVNIEDCIQNHARLKFLETLRPLVRYLISNDETHGIISNHLATAYAALIYWQKFSGETVGNAADRLLGRIVENQSSEGWFREYEGADPGYQTLCTHYLFCAFQISGDQNLLDHLKASVAFLRHFIHLDGSIGGLYGSRNTTVYYPGGIVGLSSYLNDCTQIEAETNAAIHRGVHMRPLWIDAGNFIPLLNSYAVAAYHTETSTTYPCSVPPSPATDKQHTRKFPDAGLFIHSTGSYDAWINFKKGGTLTVFDKRTRRLDLEDGGLFGTLCNGQSFSSQLYDETIDFAGERLRAGFYRIGSRMMHPLEMVLLRLLGLTLFRSIRFSDLFKRYIVRMLMTGKKPLDGFVDRQFEFHEDRILVSERIVPPQKAVKIGHYGACRAIHMASSGYLLPDRPFGATESAIVQLVKL